MFLVSYRMFRVQSLQSVLALYVLTDFIINIGFSQIKNFFPARFIGETFIIQNANLLRTSHTKRQHLMTSVGHSTKMNKLDSIKVAGYGP